MFDFIAALFDPDNEFLCLALYVGTLASLSFGIIGTYVITRRITFLAGSISHCIFGGIGAGLYLKNKIGIVWFDPMYGAILSSLFAAGIIGFITLYARQREDTAIRALWAIGMAAGLVFIDLTPGYYDISSYLFGDILLIRRRTDTRSTQQQTQDPQVTPLHFQPPLRSRSQGSTHVNSRKPTPGRDRRRTARVRKQTLSLAYGPPDLLPWFTRPAASQIRHSGNGSPARHRRLPRTRHPNRGSHSWPDQPAGSGRPRGG